jgi:hypothetical protein
MNYGRERASEAMIASFSGFGLLVLQQWLYSVEAGATAPNNLWIDMDINVWNQIGSI